MIILAIDSGVEKTGFSVFEKDRNRFKYITSGLIKTFKGQNFESRLEQIYNKLNDVIKLTNPDKIILEQIFFFRNKKTVIKIGQAQGVVILLAAQKKISVEFLSPLQIKQVVTGYGLSDKKSVYKMIKQSIKLNKIKIEDDESDAIACGLAYCYLNKTP